jgi:transposase
MENYVGIDISKHTADTWFKGDNRHRKFDYTEENIPCIIGELRAAKPVLIVMESTGGYEKILLDAVHAAGLPVAVANARRIKDFARAAGQTAKTDKIDARIIPEYAAKMQPRQQTPPDKVTFKIRSLTARRQQLTEMRTAEMNRKEHASDPVISASIDAVITFINGEIGKIETEIEKNIEENDNFKRKSEIIQSVPGFGKKTASVLIGGIPELGSLNRGQIGSLAGVAPMNRDSGRFRGKRMTGGGRTEVRTQLYMPVLVAIQHNPLIREFYHRLVENGKNKKAAE